MGNEGGRGTWPGWARGVVSAALVFHIAAVMAGAMAPGPSSALERWAASRFRGYNEAVDQGYSYRFYVNGPPPTPVMLATLNMRDGTTRELRIPDREMRPRLRYQRHLALAYHLRMDFDRAAKDERGNSKSPWARSYAKHLGAVNPGCESVTIRLTDHRNPTPHELEEAASRGRTIDVEAARYYTVPELVGEYPCAQ